MRQLKKNTVKRMQKAKKMSRRKEERSRKRKKRVNCKRKKRTRVNCKRKNSKKKVKLKKGMMIKRRQVKNAEKKKLLKAVAVLKSFSRPSNFMIYHHKAIWKYLQRY